MKIVSFNINGLRARLHQLQALIEKHQPDVIGLQEIKVHDEAFPIDDVEALGYHVYFHGQKAHYGVALLSKKPAKAIQKGFATDTEESQRRMISGTFESDSGNEVTVMNGYFPQGDNISHETKFPYKRQFYADLMTHLNDFADPQSNLVIMGDINISPLDADIGIGEQNRKRWLKTGKCSFQPEEREWLKTLLDWGFKDTFRVLTPDATEKYSWFDYRSKGFDDNRGLRIDVVLATAPLTAKCIESDIDYELRGIDKPSDHAPIWATFDI
ncbi:exodeoxyribonuclease III [Pseudoalteromonas sp. CO348]|uniref:exodeoxyribonuclease III n=1 Tax=Pseudoalteromonas TaxID=53246 RepID=UPI00102335A7|nr:MULTISPECIES: exodeoxyribonuclease III [Pseudoalteromonas]MCG7539622.1 exodeoxyribonuclease III [Pseudoalteromonas sp. OF7H-1]QZO11583.1 exodeoxyribonuclease III [Pseudoalteromonas piscicida]RZG05724.1 exodeoxyribonuclease III [Pseudoalteromonas sp. CO348]